MCQPRGGRGIDADLEHQIRGRKPDRLSKWHPGADLLLPATAPNRAEQPLADPAAADGLSPIPRRPIAAARADRCRRRRPGEAGVRRYALADGGGARLLRSTALGIWQRRLVSKGFRRPGALAKPNREP